MDDQSILRLSEETGVLARLHAFSLVRRSNSLEAVDTFSLKVLGEIRTCVSALPIDCLWGRSSKAHAIVMTTKAVGSIRRKVERSWS